MGHMLLEAYRTSGSFALTVSLAVQHLLSLLYKDKSLPLSPPSGKTQKKTTRNAEIRAKYAAGVSVPELAKEYRISKERVYQILKDIQR